MSETWNLQALLGKNTVEQKASDLLKLAPLLIKAYARRLANLEDFVAYHRLEKEFRKLSEAVFQFLNLNAEQDTLSPYQTLRMELAMKMQPLYQAVAAEEAEVIANKAKIKKYLADKRLKDYVRSYELIFRGEPHTLPARIAAYHASIRQAIEDNVQIFSVLRNAETKFDPAADSTGKQHEVTDQSVSQLLRSKDRVLRQNAFDSQTKGWLATKETLAKLIAGHFLADHRQAQAKSFKTQVEAHLFIDSAPLSLVQSLYNAAKQNLEPYKRASRARRAFLAKGLRMTYDQVMPYDKDYVLFANESDYTVKQAQKMVLDSVRPLGKEYRARVQHAFDSRWVDFHMTPNKVGGAFSAPQLFSEMQPILMNFEGSIGSVSTLAHEIGHSMHTFYCRANNPYTLSSYTAFIAEVASNFSELLLTEEILRASKSDRVRFNALQGFLDNFAGNVYYQLLFSEYEYRVSEALLHNKAVSTWSDVSQIYAEVRKQYDMHEDWKKRDPERSKVASVIIPHFYYGFYVFKYAIGMIGALALMAQLKKDPVKGAANYIKFISSGTQQWPSDVLRSVGVDLEDKTTLRQAFDLYAAYVDQYVILGKKLLKVSAKL